jgi:hypothetical protein
MVHERETWAEAHERLTAFVDIESMVIDDDGQTLEPAEVVERVRLALATAEASAQGEAGRLSESETVSLLTEAMRAADQAFERVGGSTRHHVRDCLMPELERMGLTIVRADSTSATRWVDCEERMPEPGDFAWIVWHGVVQEQPWEYTELDDGRMGWVHVESEITDGVSMWMPLPPPPKGSP